MIYNQNKAVGYSVVDVANGTAKGIDRRHCAWYYAVGTLLVYLAHRVKFLRVPTSCPAGVQSFLEPVNLWKFEEETVSLSLLSVFPADVALSQCLHLHLPEWFLAEGGNGHTEGGLFGRFGEISSFFCFYFLRFVLPPAYLIEDGGFDVFVVGGGRVVLSLFFGQGEWGLDWSCVKISKGPNSGFRFEGG